MFKGGHDVKQCDNGKKGKNERMIERRGESSKRRENDAEAEGERGLTLHLFSQKGGRDGFWGRGGGGVVSVRILSAAIPKAWLCCVNFLYFCFQLLSILAQRSV